jgi:hypothetical protein
VSNRPSQLFEQQRLLAIILVLGIGGIVAAAVSTGPKADLPAASPFATASNSWLTPDGVARAVAFRKSFGLRSEESWVRFVAGDPEGVANVPKFSIPMTDAEAADFRTRLATRETVLADLEAFRAAHVDAWGGYYLDGDAVVVLLLDATGSVEQELRKSVPPPLIVKSARWSLEELNDLATKIADDQWLHANYHLLSAGADPEHNTVAIEVSSADVAAPAAIAQHFALGAELTIKIDGTGAASLPKGTISGRAVDAEGKPAAGLDIEIVPDIPGIDTGEIARQTGDDGSFEIPDIPAAGYQIRLLTGPNTVGATNASPGVEVGEARVELKAGHTTQVTIRVSWP